MSDSKKKKEYAASVAAMARALEQSDENAFRAALAKFDLVRDTEVLTGVRKVASDLQNALDRFHIDSKLIDLAQRQVPDARHRLAHVLRLTDDAAHKTMDLVDKCCPLADKVAREAQRLLSVEEAGGSRSEQLAFLKQTADSMSEVRGNLAEVLLAQGYQDLSGQIIRGVMQLVDELEIALSELVRIAGGADIVRPTTENTSRGHGPVVPGINHGVAVSGQQDVDALLSDLGM